MLALPSSTLPGSLVSGRPLKEAISCEVYVINLARVNDRWQRLSEVLEHMGVPVTRVDAFDGFSNLQEVLAVRGLVADRNSGIIAHCNPYRWNGRSYTVSEEACFLSHLKALRASSESGSPFGLILEDDAVLPPHLFADKGPIAQCLQVAGDWDIVKLEGTKRRGWRLAVVHHRFAVGRLVASLRPSLGSAAYLVSRKGAEALLRACPAATEPFDMVLVDTGFHRARLLDYTPYPVDQDANAISHNRRVPNLKSLRPRLMRKCSRLSRTLTRLWQIGKHRVFPIDICRWVVPEAGGKLDLNGSSLEVGRCE